MFSYWEGGLKRLTDLTEFISKDNLQNMGSEELYQLKERFEATSFHVIENIRTGLAFPKVVIAFLNKIS